MPVELRPIHLDEAPALANLFELYAHDFSEHVRLELKPNGRFDVPLDQKWWTDDDHFPFFIHDSGALSGFALVRRGSHISGAPEVMDVAEFFVVRGARGKHVGTAAAHALFTAFRGTWEIRIRQSNRAAETFWRRAAEAQLGHAVMTEPYSANGVDWHVLRLDIAGHRHRSGSRHRAMP